MNCQQQQSTNQQCRTCGSLENRSRSNQLELLLFLNPAIATVSLVEQGTNPAFWGLFYALNDNVAALP